jgi:hypothetical protein
MPSLLRWIFLLKSSDDRRLGEMPRRMSPLKLSGLFAFGAAACEPKKTEQSIYL